MNRAHDNHGLTRLVEYFIVLAQSTRATQPSEGSLSDPASRQEHKPPGLDGTRDNVQPIIRMVFDPSIEIMAVVFPVRPDHAQSRESVRFDHFQDLLSSGGVI